MKRAVWTEFTLAPENSFTAEYGLVWCDSPESTLNQEPNWYGAGYFAAYLDARFGPGFIGRVWKQSLKSKTPIEAIHKLSKRHSVFHEYAVASYFARVGGEETVFARTLKRFGGRAIAESRSMALGERLPLAAITCAPLSTRYYRIGTGSQGGVLRLSSNASDHPGVAASLVISSNDWSRLNPGGIAGVDKLRTSKKVSDYAVLVVSNNGICDAAVDVQCDLDFS